MLTSTSSTNSAIQAYKVYHLSQTKLDRECRRPTPDLHRIVAHAAIVDSVRRWSRDLASSSETVVVDSDSDADSDPCEDSVSDEESEDTVVVGQVAIFDYEVDDDSKIEQSQNDGTVFEIQAGVGQPVKNRDLKSVSPPRRRAPPPPTVGSPYEIKDQSWRQHRPVVVREIAVEVGSDD